MQVLEFNNSRDEDYYKQTNNKIDPYNSCFPTAMINAAFTAKWKPILPPPEEGFEYDDQFNKYLSSPIMKSWYGSRNGKAPADVKKAISLGTQPRELWEVEKYGFNTWADVKSERTDELLNGVYIDWDLSIKKVLSVIRRGGAIVTTGVFAGYRHAVCIVGYHAEKDSPDPEVARVKSIIIDDSFGEVRTSYKPKPGIGGNDVPLHVKRFWNITEKDSERHYGIIFRPLLNYTNPPKPKRVELDPSVESDPIV
jgi:hypothetical protein